MLTRSTKSRKQGAKILIRVAVLGYGAMGRNHVRVIDQLNDFHLSAVIDPDFQVAPPKHVTAAKSIQEIDFSEVDAVVIATPSSTHEDLGVHFLQRKFHTLIEKPLASTVAGAQRLIDARKLSGVTGMVGHLERFNPAVSSLKALLDAETLGEIYQMTTRRQGFFPERIKDVGVAKDLAIHDIDLIRYLTGAEFSQVFASSACRSGRDFEDMINISGSLTTGALVNHVVNWMSPMKERIITVTGEKGTAIADTVTGELTLYENGAPNQEQSEPFFRGVALGDVHRFATSRVEPLELELKALWSSITGVDADIPRFEDGLAALQVVESALESARCSRAIQLL